MKERHYKAGIKLFAQILSEASVHHQSDELFQFLLTPKEREDIALRCLLVRELLLQKKTQREIAKKYNASITKITRGSNGLKYISKKLRALLESVFSKNNWRI